VLQIHFFAFPKHFQLPWDICLVLFFPFTVLFLLVHRGKIAYQISQNFPGQPIAFSGNQVLNLHLRRRAFGLWILIAGNLSHRERTGKAGKTGKT